MAETDVPLKQQSDLECLLKVKSRFAFTNTCPERMVNVLSMWGQFERRWEGIKNKKREEQQHFVTNCSVAAILNFLSRRDNGELWPIYLKIKTSECCSSVTGRNCTPVRVPQRPLNIFNGSVVTCTLESWPSTVWPVRSLKKLRGQHYTNDKAL